MPHYPTDNPGAPSGFSYTAPVNDSTTQNNVTTYRILEDEINSSGEVSAIIAGIQASGAPYYPTDNPVGSTELINPTDTIGDLNTALTNLSTIITNWQVALTNASITTNDKSYYAAMNSAKLIRTRDKAIRMAYILNPLTAVLTQLATVHAPVLPTSPAPIYPSSQHDGWTAPN